MSPGTLLHDRGGALPLFKNFFVYMRFVFSLIFIANMQYISDKWKQQEVS